MLETDNHYVIVVHGTWGAPIEGIPHWTILNADGHPNFASKLNDRLEELGLGRPVGRSANGVPGSFTWSGENNHEERLNGAEKLFNLIKSIEVADPSARIHIIGHSHGGNVALKAVELYLWDLWMRGIDNDTEVRDIWVLSAGTNRLGKLVFMGTPFMSKHWKTMSTLRIRWTRRVLEIPAFTSAIAVFYYVIGMFLWALLWVLVGLPFDLIRPPMLNPLGWNLWVLILFLGVMLMVGLAVAIEYKLEHEDMNYYFKPPKWIKTRIHSDSFIRAVPIPTLVVNAGYLDEVLLALSSEPIVYGLMYPRIRALLSPPTFQLATAHGAPKEADEMVSDSVVKLAWYVWVAGLRIVALLLYPFRVIAAKVLNLTLIKAVQSAAFGLPPVEFRTAIVTTASGLRNQPLLNLTDWNVAQLLLTETRTVANVEAEETSAAYRYLSDDEEKRRRIAKSMLWPHVEPYLTQIVRKYRHVEYLQEKQLREQTELVVLTIEQQLRGFLATVGLSHSRYYTSCRIIDGIATFIATGEVRKT